MSSSFAVDGALADELLDLGIAVGVVTPGAGAGPPTLNTDWFSRPAHYLGRVLGDPAQRDALLRLAAGLVGAARDELDLPAGPDGEQWVPIAVAGPPHVGVYVVLQVDGDDVLLS
ncbi:MAG TPA: hypothetical protein VGW75_07685, partial [Solirubrobacteraceae bacterium]|nr:hypothetical protein [Solirubrobacteraceae bacterium]